MVEITIRAYRRRLENPRVLLLGEHLFDVPPLWGKDYMLKLVGRVNDHGFVTEGYAAPWTVDVRCDKDGTWTLAEIKAKIASNDYLMLNHVGHSSTRSN